MIPYLCMPYIHAVHNNTKPDMTNGPIGLITFALYYYCYYNIYTRAASIMYYIHLFYIFNKIQRNSTALTITF